MKNNFGHFSIGTAQEIVQLNPNYRASHFTFVKWVDNNNKLEYTESFILTEFKTGETSTFDSKGPFSLIGDTLQIILYEVGRSSTTLASNTSSYFINTSTTGGIS